jgi:hypothetical protein
LIRSLGEAFTFFGAFVILAKAILNAPI